MKPKVDDAGEGLPRPPDIFDPHMPGVDIWADIDGVFEMARDVLLNRNPPPYGIERAEPGQRSIAIVTPERQIMLVPCPSPGSMPIADVTAVAQIMPADPPLTISVVSYTFYSALIDDKVRCIPFIGCLSGWGYIGHSVVIFEGHPSAFASGVRESDVLIVDSVMLPFLQSKWADVAKQVMRPRGRIFIHDRASFSLLPAASSNNEQGWQYSEPDGEASYLNCLLTTLAKGSCPQVTLSSGSAPPNLAEINTNPQDSEWIAALPFEYEKLNSDAVIDTLLKLAEWGKYDRSQTTGVFQAVLALNAHETWPVSFYLRLSIDTDLKRRLQMVPARPGQVPNMCGNETQSEFLNFDFRT